MRNLKRFGAGAIAVLQILVMSVPNETLAATSQNQSTIACYGSTTSSGGSCKASCGDYNTAKSRCATPPASCTGCVRNKFIAGLPSDAMVWQNECSDASWKACWATVGPQCEAMEMSKTSGEGEMAFAILWTIIGASCSASCYGIQAAITAPICGFGMIAVGLAEMGYSISEAKHWEKGMLNGLPSLAPIVATVVAGSMGNWAAGSACPAAPITAVVLAGWRWYNYAQAVSKKEDACKAVKNAESKGGTSNILGGASVPGHGGGNKAGTSTDSSIADTAAAEVQKYLNGDTSAAIAGPIVNIPREDLRNAMDALGLTPKGIADQLKDQNPAAALNSLSFLGDDMKAPLNDIDGAIKSGKIADIATSDRVSATGGGGPKKGGSDSSGGLDLAALFGAKKEDGKEGLGLKLDFGKKQNLGATDIWHTNSTQSIFEIVSTRIDKSQDRVTKCEWASPLNRALTGTKPAAAVKK